MKKNIANIEIPNIEMERDFISQGDIWDIPDYQFKNNSEIYVQEVQDLDGYSNCISTEYPFKATDYIQDEYNSNVLTELTERENQPVYTNIEQEYLEIQHPVQNSFVGFSNVSIDGSNPESEYSHDICTEQINGITDNIEKKTNCQTKDRLNDLNCLKATPQPSEVPPIIKKRETQERKSSNVLSEIFYVGEISKENENFNDDENFQHVSSQTQIEVKPEARTSKSCKAVVTYSSRDFVNTYEIKHLVWNGVVQEGVQVCDECKNLYLNENALNNHMRKVHAKNQTFNFQCVVCPKTLRNEKNLKRHTKLCHGSNAYPCNQCSAYYSNELTRAKHLVQFHIGKIGPTGKKIEKKALTKNQICYICKECGHPSSLRKNHCRHFKLRHTHCEKRYICDECGHRSVLESNHNVHMASRHMKNMKFSRKTQ